MSYYASLGWSLSNPITDSNDYDFIAEDKEGNLLKIQAKTTRYKAPSGNYLVGLSTNGGNQREYWNKELNIHNIDYVFIATDDGICYSIPAKELTSSNSITLYDYYEKFKVMAISTDIREIEKETLTVIHNTKSKEQKEYFCPECGEKVSKKGVLCRKCAALKNGEEHRKVERPDKDTLLKQLSTSNMTKVGEYYGVTDNAVRKWLKTYKLPTSMKVLRDEGLI